MEERVGRRNSVLVISLEAKFIALVELVGIG